ncbi:MAG TPA: ABC-type transport auxiliary lipoprotein family protein [Dissulfurispiraceae bacterium]
MRTFLACISFLFFVSACSMTMPETKIYNVYIPAEKVSPGKRSDVSLAVMLDSPRYLAQPYIAYRTSPYQLAISKYSKWDIPPADMVMDMVSASLASTGTFREIRTSHVVPGGFYSLRMNLKKFELLDTAEGPFGELSFDATLISPEGAEHYRGEITKKVKLEDKSFLSLAKGMSSALAEGIAEIRAGIAASLAK